MRDTIFVPLEWNGKIAELKTKVLASLKHPIVLGLDALKLFGVIVDFARDNYFFATDPTKTYPFYEVPAPAAEQHLLNSLIDQGIRELTTEQKSRLQAFITEKVPPLPEKLPCTNVAEHKIELIPGSKPFKIPQYTVPQALQAQMNAEIDKKLADGVIEPAQSEWSSPIVMVRKSDGKYRMCQDYRRLNEVTVKDVYPIPQIDSILSKLRNAKYITKLDLSQAFHQIVITEEHRNYTAFGVPGRVPFATDVFLLDYATGPRHCKGSWTPCLDHKWSQMFSNTWMT